MLPNPTKQSALQSYYNGQDSLTLSYNDVTVTEIPFKGYINIRGDANDSSFVDGVSQCLDLALPVKPNSFSQNNTVICLWLSPDEWLILTKEDAEASVIDALQHALQERNAYFAITDLSSGYTLLKMTGQGTEDLLNKGTTLDLRPKSFTDGQCAGTHLGHTNIILYKQVDFYIIVRRSFADYVWKWLNEVI